jgi:beta-xylosidase
MPDEGIYVTTSDDPAGKWSEPHLVQEGKGLIDPCPLWDEDGQAYLVHAYARSRAGIKHRLRVRPMAPDASRLLSEGQIVFHEPDRHPTLEGPKFLKKDGWYYILAPAGGVESGWQVALRSRLIYGPYEDKIVLQQGTTAINGPHQGALLDTPNGSWWFMHFQDAGVYGRIVHLQPVIWKDGWPLMGLNRNGIDEPVARHHKPCLSAPGSLSIPQTSDEFDTRALGLQWQWQANHVQHWYELGAQQSRLRLYPQLTLREQLNLTPNLLLQKFPARSFTAETSMEFFPHQHGEEAGLVVAGESSAALALERNEFRNQLVLHMDGNREVIHDSVPHNPILRVIVTAGGLCRFSFATNGNFVEVPRTFAARKGVWIGAKVGLYSRKRLVTGPSGFADFDYFRFL